MDVEREPQTQIRREETKEAHIGMDVAILQRGDRSVMEGQRVSQWPGAHTMRRPVADDCNRHLTSKGPFQPVASEAGISSRSRRSMSWWITMTPKNPAVFGQPRALVETHVAHVSLQGLPKLRIIDLTRRNRSLSASTLPFVLPDMMLAPCTIMKINA